MKLRHLLVPLVLAMLLPAGGSAQQASYESMRDSLTQLKDVPLLRRMERALVLPGAARTVEPVVRRGLIALRLWELAEDREDAERARETFERAVERFPREPWSHYGLALALAHGPDVRLPFVGGVLPQVTLGQTVAEVLGRDPKSKARNALRKALELDPKFAPAAVLLGDLALADGRDPALVREARDALMRARTAGADAPGLARALADLETALGNYGAAADAAALAGGAESAGTLRSRGIALLLQPGREFEGYRVYRRAIERLDAAAAELFYADLAVLLNPQEAAEWRANEAVALRRTWLERFWDRRAAEAGVQPAERVAEHYRRLALARASYVRNARRGSENTGSLLGEEAVATHIFDDRGVVLIRHGEPLRVVSSKQKGLLPNESWVYEIPGHGPQLFHFVALRGAQDYTLVGDVLQALDTRTPLNLDERQRTVTGLIEDRALYEPGYRAQLGRLRELLLNPLARLDGTEIRAILERPDAEYRKGARVALRTDTQRQNFAGELPFYADLFTFRTPESRTDLTAALAIPAGQLQALAGSGGREYALRLSVILTDTLQDVVTRRDTVQIFRLPAPLAPAEFLRTHVTMPVIPSEHTLYRLVVTDGGSGKGRMESGGTRLRSYSGTGLMVSDVVLALPDSAGDWHRGEVGLALALPREFSPERPFTVFYELYNLPAETPYTTEITVEPAERGNLFQRALGLGPDRIRVQFQGVAAPGADGIVQEVRQVGSELEPGRYRLEVNVTNRSTGESAGTVTIFTVNR